MAKRAPWYHDLAKVIPTVGALIGIVTWITTAVMADAKRKVENDQLHDTVAELEKKEAEDAAKIEENAVTQKLIQHDLASIEKTQEQILEALKPRR